MIICWEMIIKGSPTMIIMGNNLLIFSNIIFLFCDLHIIGNKVAINIPINIVITFIEA